VIRLLIADDHPVVREGLRRIVQESPGLQVVGEVASGHELLERLPLVPADIVLLDVAMPGLRFLEVLGRLRSEHPTVAVLVLSVHP
jgi:DNA-binding NarL/FixJ family response regulator